ncbi:hypothetical protein D3C81_1388150 [compost metagenome]
MYGVYNTGISLTRRVTLVAVPKPVAGFRVMLLPLSCQALLFGSHVVYVPSLRRMMAFSARLAYSALPRIRDLCITYSALSTLASPVSS